MHLYLKPLVRLLLCLLPFFSFQTWAETTAPQKPPIFVPASWAFDNQKNIKFIDLSDKMSYQKFHLPNALWINYAWLIKPQDGLQLSGGTVYMTRLLSQLGIQPTDYLVIYDNLGNLDASRFYWEMIQLAHPKVSMLNGGSVNWILHGYPVTQKPPEENKKSLYPVPKHDFTQTFTADKKEVIAAITDPDVLLVDARSQEEYIGSAKEKRSGHIPSAVFFPWDISVHPQDAFKQRSDKQLSKILTAAKLGDKNKKLILYCSTAHRAARLVPMFLHLGYSKVQLYDGSMQEWLLDPSLPLKTGDQP